MSEDESPNKAKVVGVFMTLPFVLGVPPLVGWLIGSWLDKLANTSPYLMFLFILLGFIAAFKETVRIIKTFGNKI